MPISIYDKLNKGRLVLLMEAEPFSNKYFQIVLDKTQFKKLSDFLAQEIMTVEEGHKDICNNAKCDGKVFQVEDLVISLPDIPDIYEDEV